MLCQRLSPRASRPRTGSADVRTVTFAMVPRATLTEMPFPGSASKTPSAGRMPSRAALVSTEGDGVVGRTSAPEGDSHDAPSRLKDAAVAAVANNGRRRGAFRRPSMGRVLLTRPIIAVSRAGVEARIVGRARPDGRSGRRGDEHAAHAAMHKVPPL